MQNAKQCIPQIKIAKLVHHRIGQKTHVITIARLQQPASLF